VLEDRSDLVEQDPLTPKGAVNTNPPLLEEITLIKKISGSVLHADGFVTHHLDDVEFPSGARGKYHRVTSGTGLGVVVMPLFRGRVALVSQHRHPLGKVMWELPRGGADSTEVASEAVRELSEETGGHVRELTSLGVVHPDSGLLTTTVHLFLAELTGDDLRPLDEVEDLRWVEVADLDRVLLEEVTDALTLATVLRARALGLV
jgi:ADP-ribose pyrophosphatase